MVTMRGNPVSITQTNIIKNSKHTNIKHSKTLKMTAGSKAKNNESTKQPGMNKMTIVSPYILIITLDGN